MMYYFYNLWGMGYNEKMERSAQHSGIFYGWHASPFGEDMLIGLSEQGVCWAGFPVGESRTAGEERMRACFPEARFTPELSRTGLALEALICAWRGEEGASTFPFDLRGTDFQRSVWAALLQIPFGKTVCYQYIANSIGTPRAVRAVGTACGRNPVSVFVPCHRVLSKGGGIGGYGWGILRKKFILGLEK